MPIRSQSLKTLLKEPGLKVLQHAQPYFSSSEPRSRFTDDRAARDIWGRELVLGEIGCHWSHRCAFEAALAKGSEWLLVLEDDVEVSLEFEAGVARVLDQLVEEEGPTIVNLDLRERQRLGVRLGTSLVSESTGRGANKDLRDPVILALNAERVPRPNSSAYVINRLAMEVALRTPWQVASPPDWPPWACSTAFYSTTVRLAQAPLGESTIGYRCNRPPWRSRIRRLVMGASGMNFILHREHYVDVRNYLKYEYGLRLLEPLRIAVERTLPGKGERWNGCST